MAKTNAQACKDSRDKAAAEHERLGIVVRKWPISKGVDTKIKELCAAHGFKGWRELMDTVIQRLHEGPPAEVAHWLAVSQHQFTPSEKMLRQIADYTPPPEPE